MCSSVWPALIYSFKCCLPRIGNGCPPVTNSDWEGVSLTLSFALGTKGVRILSDRGQETFRAAGSFFHPQWSFDLFPKSICPHSLGKIKCQDGSSWQPLASERLCVPGGCAWPGRCGQGAVRGFMAQFHVESPQGMRRLPKIMSSFAVEKVGLSIFF